MSTVAIPASLSSVQIKPGQHRKGLKATWFGADKEGTSTALASYPSPKICIAAGEDGISQYLNDNDEMFLVRNPDQYAAALHLALKNEAHFKGVIHDNFNLLYEDWLDSWEEKLGGEIKGGSWKKVKRPWRKLLREVMYSSLHVGYGVWLKDLQYRKKEGGMPGSEGGLEIVEWDAPNIEKIVRRVVDMTFRCAVVRDAKGRPTKTHTVMFYGGRRPKTVPPADLHTGKIWKFDSSAPVNVWDTVIGPIIANWGPGAVDHLGVDPETIAEAVAGEVEFAEMQVDQDNEFVGSVLASLAAAVNLEALKQVWTLNEAAINGLPPAKKQIVVDAKKQHPFYPKGAK